MPSLLVVGPLPPPLTGTPVSFEVFCEQASSSLNLNLVIIDSSPKYLKQEKNVSLSLKNIKQAIGITLKFTKSISKSDSVLIFGSSGYIISMCPLLLLISKIFRKPFYFRSFGGVLDQYISNLAKPMSILATTTLRHCNGVIVETKLLQDSLQTLTNSSNLFYVPGYRNAPDFSIKAVESNGSNKPLHLVFVGIVKKEKGIFDLLNALEICETTYSINLRCTFFGSIHEPDRPAFLKRINEISAAVYGGELDWREVIPTLRDFDALLLPTYYPGEGHPGVLIEAMMAGIPIIASRFRSIPEIVTHNHNGLLFEPRNISQLASNIKIINTDRKLLNRLGDNNSREGKKYRTDLNVERIIEIVTTKHEKP